MLKIYDIIFEEKNIELAPWNQTKWLVLSSYIFMIPSMYAYINQLYFHSGLLFFTSLISVNFWRKATYSWRRNMDLIVAKISFTIFTYNGIIYVNYTPHLIIVYIGLFMIIYCYHLSEKLHKINNNNWYKYHMLFHFSMMCEQLIILNSLSKTKMLNLN